MAKVAIVLPKVVIIFTYQLIAFESPLRKSSYIYILKLNNQIMKSLYSTLCLIMFTTLAFGQNQKWDKIYLVNKKEPTEVKVIEISSDEVKVTQKNNDVIYTYSKYEVVKIEFANGTTEEFDTEADALTLEYYPKSKLNAIKIDPIAPLSSSLPIFWERIIKPGISYEAELRLIGVGRKQLSYTYDPNLDRTVEQNLTPAGVNIGIGYKAIRMPDFKSGKLHMRSLMQGSYIKPKVNFYYYNAPTIIYYQVNSVYVERLENLKIGGAMLAIDFGRQWAIGDRIVLDASLGLGVWADNQSKRVKEIVDDNGNIGYDINITGNYGFTKFNNSVPAGVGISGNLKLGYLFDLKRDKERKAPQSK